MNAQNGHPSQVLHERIDSITSSIASSLKSVADQLSSMASLAKDRASEVTSHTASTASSLGARASRAIQEHPIAAITVVVGAGYLLMRLIRR
jgi:ElaB/YqjD/DUF883 family membrane-anchored ribosome-binding protein